MPEPYHELRGCWPLQRFNASTLYLSRRSPATAGRRRNILTNLIDLTRPFLTVSKDMRRLFVEIAIIAAVIFFGWNTPYKDWTAQAYEKINSAFDSMGGNLQKNQDPSVKRY